MIPTTVSLCLMVSLSVGLKLTPESGSILAEVGESVTFRCQGEPSKIGLDWITPSGQSVPSDSSKRVYLSRSSNTDVEVTIRAVRDEDVGEWTCSGSSFFQPVSGTMTISLKQRVSARLVHKGPVLEGGKAVFDCTARGYPLPTVQWFHNSNVLDRSAARVTVTENRLAYAVLSKLVISNVEESDAGNFVCRVQNSAGTSVSSSLLSVNSNPEVSGPKQPTGSRVSIRSFMSSSYVRAGGRAYFVCRAAGNPTPVVSWRHSSDAVVTSNRISISNQYSSGVTTSRMTISDVRASDAGSYTCQARNSAGSTSSGRLLRVVGGLIAASTQSPTARRTLPVTKRPENVATRTRTRRIFSERVSARLTVVGVARRGGKLELDCKVTGPSNATVSWYKNYRPIIEGESTKFGTASRNDGTHYKLVIDSAERSDSGMYKCQVRTRSSSSSAQRYVFIRR